MARKEAERSVFPEAPGVRVETVCDYQSFLDLEPAWNDLLERSGIDHPFLTHEWVRTSWECFGAGNELRILVLRKGGEILAIAPMMLGPRWMYGRMLRRLQFISNIHTQRFDFIMATPGEEAYRALWSHLRDHRGEWDLLELCQLPASSRTLEELPRQAAEDGFLTGLWRSSDSPYLPLAGSWEDYFGKLRGKHRSNLRNRLKRLSRLGPVDVEVLSSAEGLACALEEGMAIEAAAWKGRAASAIRSRPDLHLFYTRLARRAAHRGWLRLDFLKLGSRRIAFDYSLCYKNKLYLLKPGYDPEYAAFSPSNLLRQRILQSAYEQGLSEYDFLGMDEEWKLDWTQHRRPHYWLFIFPDSLAARLIHSVKFRLLPQLQRRRSYRSLRDALLGLARRIPRR